MTTLFDYLEESSADFTSRKIQQTLLSKRVNTTAVDDLLTKKIKTKTLNISTNSSTQHSPLTEEAQFKSCNTTEERSMAIEGASEDEHFLEQKPEKSYSIPPFEFDTQCSLNSGDLNASTVEPFSRMSSLLSNNINKSPSPINRSDQENAEQLSEALEVLRMRFKARDETAFLQETVMKLFLAQEPKRIPPFAGFNISAPDDVLNKSENKGATKIQDQSDVIYGQLEFPFLSLTVPFTKSEKDLKSDLQEQVLSETKSSKQKKLSILGISGKDSSIIEESTDIVKQKKVDSKDSLAATRAGTQRSDSDAEITLRRSKKERKVIKTVEETLNRKKNTKFVQSLNKEELKEESPSEEIPLDEPYAFSLKQKKSRAERQRTRWESVQGRKLSISDYFTQVLNAGSENPKKEIPVPIGADYQADLSIIPFKQGKTERRKLKAVWDPSSLNQNELNTFLKNLKTCLKTDINQEKGIILLIRNDADVKKTLMYAKDNKAKCLKELAL